MSAPGLAHVSPCQPPGYPGTTRVRSPWELFKYQVPGLCLGQAEASALPPPLSHGEGQGCSARAALHWTTQKFKNFKLNLYNTLIIYIA